MVCFYCRRSDLIWARELGENVQPDRDKRPIATIDHLRQVAHGGTNELKNMIIACRPCHNERHHG